MDRIIWMTQKDIIQSDVSEHANGVLQPYKPSYSPNCITGDILLSVQQVAPVLNNELGVINNRIVVFEHQYCPQIWFRTSGDTDNVETEIETAAIYLLSNVSCVHPETETVFRICFIKRVVFRNVGRRIRTGGK